MFILDIINEVATEVKPMVWVALGFAILFLILLRGLLATSSALLRSARRIEARLAVLHPVEPEKEYIAAHSPVEYDLTEAATHPFVWESEAADRLFGKEGKERKKEEQYIKFKREHLRN